MEKSAMVPAKRPSERLVAVFSQDLFPGKSGNPFGFFIKKQNPPFQIVGDDSFLEVIQNPFQGFSTGYEPIDTQSRAFLKRPFLLQHDVF